MTEPGAVSAAPAAAESFERMTMLQLAEFVLAELVHPCVLSTGEFAGKTVIVLDARQVAGVEQFAKLAAIFAQHDTVIREAIKQAGQGPCAGRWTALAAILVTGRVDASAKGCLGPCPRRYGEGGGRIRRRALARTGYLPTAEAAVAIKHTYVSPLRGRLTSRAVCLSGALLCLSIRAR